MAPPQGTSAEPIIVRGACHHDCPDTCVWNATVSDGRVVTLRGDPDHPTTHGQLCPKINRFIDRVYDPDRIVQPLRRTGPKGRGAFEVVTWDEAVSEIAHRLTGVIAEYGSEAILPYSFAGTQGTIQMGVMADRFFSRLDASDIHRHLCGVTATLGAADVTGTPFGIDPEDLRHSRTVVLWGTNTLLTNRHLWPTIQTAKARGATVIVIDPIRTTTASAPDVDRFIQIRPGTDVALVLGMVRIMMRDGLLDHAWLDTATDGWDQLEASAFALSLERVETITGIDMSEVEWLAHTYATQRPAAIRVLIGPEHREHGRDIARAVAMLPAVTAAWRNVGGGLARSTQIYFEEALNYPSYPDGRRMFNMAELGSILTNDSLDPPIRSLIVHNCNPAVITPDQNAVITGLGRDDLFTVVLEQFMTDTARFADIVLPATTQLEHLDLMAAWGHLYLALNRPAITPIGGALPNTEIFRRLAAAMGFDDPGFEDSDEDLVRQLLDSTHPWMDGITFDRLWKDGWARLNIPPGHRANVDTPPSTGDGRLHLGSLEYLPGTETVEGDPDLAERFPLTLMSRKQHPKFLNSQYGGSTRHLPAAGEPRLDIHPVDAAQRSIEDGDLVHVFNDRGALSLRASVSDTVQPGLLTMPFGWWNRQSPDDRGVNALTNPAVQGDTGSAAFHENLVQVVATR